MSATLSRELSFSASQQRTTSTVIQPRPNATQVINSATQTRIAQTTTEPPVTTAAPLHKDPMLKTRQVAVLLNVSPETMKKWRQRKKGPPFVRCSRGAIRYRMSKVLAFIESNSVEY